MSETAYTRYLDQIDQASDKKQVIDKELDDYTIRKAKSYLFFDDDTEVEFLASQRFPSDPLGAYRYENIDGTLYYRDDNNKLQPEFPDNDAVGFFGNKVVPNLIPATNLAADVAGGIAGMKQGLKTGAKLVANPALPWTKNPYAAGAVILASTAAGGFAGNLASGAAARGGREAIIDNFYNLPPEELAAAYKDLKISAAFSALPFGTGPTRRVINKFTGSEDTLKYLVGLRASTDETIQEAKRLGFDITSAEAAEIGSRASTLQHFLSNQPQISSITRHYDNRASQVRESIEVLAETIGSGKPGDVNTRLADAGTKAIDELANRRRMRAGKLYDYIKNSPEPIKVNGVDDIIKRIDSKIAGEVLDDSGTVIRTMDPDPTTVKNLQEFKKVFYDSNGDLITDLASLDARRTSTMQKIINDVSGTGDFGVITGFRNDLTAMMDEAEPIYALARRVYDPTKPALQMVEKSSIGRLSKLMTDKQSATAMKNLFDPSVSIKSLRNSRRVLQAIDPDLFQDVKKEYILQQLNRVTNETLEQGLPRFQKYFAQDNISQMMQEMLSPEEYVNFNRTIELMGKAFSVPKGGSPTQPFQALEQGLTQESTGLGMKATNGALALVRLPARLMGFGDEITNAISAKQRDVYYQKLADLLIDPNATKNIDDIYNYVNVVEPAMYQGLMRGTDAGVEALSTDESGPYEGNARQDYIQSLESQIDSLSPTDGAMNTIPTTTKPTLSLPQMTSPTILPDERDREIAMRQQSGIAGLV